MAASDEIKKFKDQAALAKAEMDRLLAGADALTRKAIKQTDEYKKQVTILKESNEQVQELLSIQKQTVDSLINQESKLKGLKGLQASLVQQDRDRILLQDKIDGSYGKSHEALNSIASLNQELLGLSAEDFVGKKRIEESISQQLYDVIGMEGVTDEIVENLMRQFETAKGVSSMTEKQQEFLNKQLAVYEGIQDTIGGVLQTAQLLMSTPAGVFGAALIAIGASLDKIGQTTREFGGTMGGAVVSTTALGLVFKDATGSAKGLAAEFGGLEDISFATQLNTNLMATNMGISGAEAAKTLNIFSRLNGNSKDTAFNMAESVASMADAAGLNTAQVMGDVSANAEAFALFSRDGGENLGMAAIQAAKLGVNMSTLTNVADSLLDFETSITKELELGAMLGRNINLNRARSLAYEGKIGASVKETIAQLGGVAEFNKMDYYAKKQTAALLGISVDELSKMANNMDKLNDDGSFQKSTWDSIGELITAATTGPLGSFLKGVGGIVIALGQAVIQAKLMSAAMAGENTTKGLLSSINPFSKKGPTPTPTIQTPPPINTQPGPGQVNKMGGGINMRSVLQGAAAMLILAGAMFVFAKASQEFGGVDFSKVFIGIGAMATLGVVAGVLGIGPIAAAVGMGTLLILGLSAAFFVFASGALIMATAVTMIANALPLLANGITSLVPMIGGIFGLAGAFTALGFSLAVLGSMGLIALPVLLGIGAAAAGLGLLFGALGVGESGGIEEGSLSQYEETMLQKMDSLIQAVSSNKDVYLDKDKVTSLVMQTSDRSIVNKLNIFNA